MNKRIPAIKSRKKFISVNKTDETHAAPNYMKGAKMFEKAGQKDVAKKLRGIAKDERRHKKILSGVKVK